MDGNCTYTDREGKTFDAIVESARWVGRNGSCENGSNVAAAATTFHLAFNIRVKYPIAKNGPRHSELTKGGAELNEDWRPVFGIFQQADVGGNPKAFVSMSDEVRAQFAPPKPEQPAPAGNTSYGEVIPGDVAAVELQRREASYEGSGVPKRKGPVGV